MTVELVGTCLQCGAVYAEDALVLCECCEEYVCAQCNPPMKKCSICGIPTCYLCLNDSRICSECMEDD